MPPFPTESTRGQAVIKKPTRPIRAVRMTTSSDLVSQASSSGPSSSDVTQAAPTTRDRTLPKEWQELLVDTKKHLLIGCDIGTTKIAICWGFQTNFTTPANIYIHNLDFGSEQLMPSEVGLLISTDKSGTKVKLVHGRKAKNLINGGDIKAGHIFINLKQSKPFADPEAPESRKRREYLRQLQKAHSKILEEVKDHPAYISHEWLEQKQKSIGKLTTIKDVVRWLFELVLMDIKVGMRSASNLDKDELDEMFGSGKVNALAAKLRMGVAVPEMWSKERLEMYTLLTSAGFPSSLEILSESKCAAVRVLRLKVDELCQEDADKRDSLLKLYGTKPLVVLDRGGHTLDISTMVIVQDQNGFIRFKAITDCTSTQDGGDRANDKFLQLLPTLFGDEFESVMDSVTDDGETANELRFKQKFMASFETQKREGFGTKGGHRQVVYSGQESLPKGDNGKKADWKSKRISIPCKALNTCVRVPAREIVAPNGPLHSHLTMTREATDLEPELLFSGGGSVDQTFQEEVRKEFGNVAFQTIAHAAQSLVAGGIVLNLLDTDVCNDQKISKKSYGIVHDAPYDPQNPIHQSRQHQAVAMAPHMSSQDIKGKKELPKTVAWKAYMNSSVRHTSDDQYMQHVLFSADPQADENGWDMEIRIMESEDKTLAFQDGHRLDTTGIKTAATWKIHINKTLAKKIARKIPGSVHGFIQHEGSEEWQLEFDYLLRYRWAGMLQLFEVRIPYGGCFPENNDELGPDDEFIARYRLTGDCNVAADAGDEMDWEEP